MVRVLLRLLKPLKRAINQMLTRGVVHLVDAGKKMQVLQVRIISEHPNEVEHFEPYGFTSHPKKGAEVLLAALGGRRAHTVAICVADRRFRVTGLAAGEVCIHDDQGNIIHFQRDRIMVNAVTHLDITAPTCKITATTTHDGDVAINGDQTFTGNLILNGDANITGSLTVGGAIVGQGGMAISGGSGASVEGDFDITSGDVTADGISLKGHTHQDSQGGTTSSPQ